MTDPNLIYPGRYDDFTFPEEGSDMPTAPTRVQIAAALEELRDKGITEGGVRCALAAAAEAGWKCKAQRTADPPQDCDWPVCGCDPYADKVIAALQESSFTAAAEPPMELTKEASDETIRRLAKKIAAAEAGEQIQVLKTVEANTIKRCAQVAKNTYINPASLLSPQEQIAATIMALIDQAPHSFEDNPLDWRRP